MAKKSMIERNNKRKRTVEKYAEKRADLKDQFEQAGSQMEKMEIHRKIQQLPRDSSRNPCQKPLLVNWTPQRVLSGFWIISERHSGNGPCRVITRCG